jgi:hypothetical protein
MELPNGLTAYGLLTHNFNLSPTPLISLPLSRSSRINSNENSLHPFKSINHSQQLFGFGSIPINVKLHEKRLGCFARFDYRGEGSRGVGRDLSSAPSEGIRRMGGKHGQLFPRVVERDLFTRLQCLRHLGLVYALTICIIPQTPAALAKPLSASG